jgi:hypothetical protein
MKYYKPLILQLQMYKSCEMWIYFNQMGKYHVSADERGGENNLHLRDSNGNL